MDALIGLTLDSSAVATSATSNLPAAEGEMPFETVLVAEMGQVQNAEDSALLNADLLENMLENSLESAKSDDPEVASEALKTEHKKNEQLDNSVNLLLSVPQPVTVKVSAEVVATDISINLNPTIQLSADASATASDSEQAGNTDALVGKELPLPDKTLARTVISLKQIQEKNGAQQVDEAGTVAPIAIQAHDNEPLDVTELSLNTDEVGVEVVPLAKPDKNEQKSKTSNSAAAIAVNQGLDVGSLKWALQNQNHKVTTHASTQAPVLSANNVLTTASRETPSLLAAQSGDLNKWLSSDDKRANTRSDVSSSPFSQVMPETKTSEASMPQALRFSLSNPRFNDVLSNQVLWQAKQGITQADIHLHPVELGPITVRLTQNGQETSVQFVVAHPGTKEQLEQALPRLREVMQSGGLQLTNVDVQDGRKHPSQHGNDAPPSFFSRSTNNAVASAISSSLAAPQTTHAEGIIDFYA